ncbi:unnamed protein product, partial [Porites evermanni]
SREQCQSRLFTREKRTRSRLGISGERWAIGIYKNRIFQPMTNFHIACKGFVSNGSAVEGYLVDKIPAHCQCLDGVQANSESSTHSFTSSEMSPQQEILRKIPGKGIWTAPSRDQYLPAYFKDVCDQYLLQPNAGELKPVK